ncbi:S8 family serine peptidase [Streptomyces sp. NPDC014773]|uniref:S8 family serine peptidase n=1 Tax=Streptomyces sp. NPDC014773 TaxID=3364908 RepID=UPI0036FC5954
MRTTLRRSTASWAAVVCAVSLSVVCSGPPAQAGPGQSIPAPAPTPTPAPAPLPVPVHTTGNAPAARYIVTLADAPVALYRGGTDDLAATAPAPGAKVDAGSRAARRYRDHLQERQSEAATSVGARIRGRYTVAVNGFTADLTVAQAARLKGSPGVLDVSPDGRVEATDDSRSTDFLGLPGPRGLWARLGGTEKSGEGVVVGVIDSGIWPESASFAGAALGTAPPTAKDPHRPYRDGDAIVMRKADGSTFTGACRAGERFTADDCNTKLVSARYYNEGWLAATPEPQRGDFLSARDSSGHGTHTASTAAGDAGVRVSVDGHDLGETSGVAPGAVVAAYKALWTEKGTTSASGYDSDIVAAVDQAVADGVDVLNFSAGKDRESKLDMPVQQAFLAAARAGVFVSAAAGNSGASTETIDNTAPWTTTVAASTMAPTEATVELGDGRAHVGASNTVRTVSGPVPLVRAQDVRAAGASEDDARLCRDGSLDPARTTGKAVVCDRGVTLRPTKSAEVARAGGVAMVLVNTEDLDVDSDLHAVPTVHLNVPGASEVRAYAAAPGATVTLRTGGSTGTPYPQIAPFSSRGPSVENKGALIKPDIAAPGVSVLAAVSPPGDYGREFDFMTGTSMAAPQIAGLAALHFGVHPAWSPMAVKSAMMTTAVATRTASGGVNTDVNQQGSGQVNPAAMLDPGLVYDSTAEDWLAYEEGLGIDTGTGVAPIAPSDLNYPSLSVDRLLGSRTLTRTLTATRPGAYRASAELPGFRVEVTPSTLRFSRAGQSAKVTVKLTRTTAPSGVPVTGNLTWTGHGHLTVRSPLAVTPRMLEAPGRIAAEATEEGSLAFSVTPGTEKLALTAYAPVAGPPVTGELATARGDVQEYAVTVPEGNKATEFFVRTDAPDARTWMYVASLSADGQPETLLDWSSTGSTTSLSPKLAPGRYLLTVVASAHSPGTSSTGFTLRTNLVNADSPVTGSFDVSPARPEATPYEPFSVTGRWSGVTQTPATAYVEYPDGTGTVVSIGG